jgi:4,5-DOPA dioxygenase extradiol
MTGLAQTTLAVFPPLFVSHGAPTLALAPGATGAFWARLGATLGTPQAIVVFSPHTYATAPVIFGAAQHTTTHDFSGFSPKLYRLRYDAPGAPEVAAQVSALFNAAHIAHNFSDDPGLDHGIWVPLMNMYPQADVPVLPIALSPHLPPAAQMAIGRALAPLADAGVLLLGSGSIVHNLREVFGPQGMRAVDAAEAPWCSAFRTWVAGAAARGDWAALQDYRAQAPHAVQAHPTDEHWLPFYVAAGAAGAALPAQRIFEGVTHACLGMDAYAFGDAAPALAARLAAAPASGHVLPA